MNFRSYFLKTRIISKKVFKKLGTDMERYSEY